MPKVEPTNDEVTRTLLVELLEPVIAGAMEEHQFAFDQPTARRLLQALASIGARYYLLNGGSAKAAVAQCIRAVRIAEVEAEESRAFSAVTQPPAQA